MSPTKKTILGIMTLWPLLYGVWFIINFFGWFANNSLPPTDLFYKIFAIQSITTLLILGLLIYYVVDINRNLKSQNDKIAWILAMIFFSFFAMTAYYLLYIVKRPAK